MPRAPGKGAKALIRLEGPCILGMFCEDQKSFSRQTPKTENRQRTKMPTYPAEEISEIRRNSNAKAYDIFHYIPSILDDDLRQYLGNFVKQNNKYDACFGCFG